MTQAGLRTGVTAVVLCLVIGPAAANDHVGTWRLEMQEQVLEMVLNADGTGTLGGQPFHYQLQGGMITVTEATGETNQYGILVMGDQLHLTSQEGTLPFQRVAAPPTGGALGGGQGPLGGALGSAGSSVVGVWQGAVGGSPVTLDLRADGSMVFAGVQGTYLQRPGQLDVTLAGQTGTYGLRLEGASLYLTGADLGGTVQFTRSDGGAAGASPATAAPGNSNVLQFSLHTYASDQSVRVGYPNGWTPSEFGGQGVLGVMFTESSSPQAAGIMTVVVPVAAVAGIETSQQLAQFLLEQIVQQALPDLEVLGQKAHPQASDVTLTDIRASDGDTLFNGHLCSALVPVGPEVSLGVFSLIYAPSSRWASFNTEQMLTGNLAPVFGSLAKMAGAQQQGSDWQPPSYEGYAYGMGGYEQGMLEQTDQAVSGAAEQQMTAEMMAMQHQTIMDGMATMTAPTYDAGWYGDTYVDGSGFSYDYGSGYY